MVKKDEKRIEEESEHEANWKQEQARRKAHEDRAKGEENVIHHASTH